MRWNVKLFRYNYIFDVYGVFLYFVFYGSIYFCEVYIVIGTIITTDLK